MTSYRFARRSFLRAVGAGAGLATILRNLEAAAAGAPPPPRFLLAAWPCGTVRYHFAPAQPGASYVTSRILQPFEDAGLRPDMTVLYGLSLNGIPSMGGGGAEAGTVKSTTGAPIAGVRQNGGESDDAAAGGPSFDQIFLRHAPALQRPGLGYANAIGDARVDSFETSTQCLSYAYTKRSVVSARDGATFMENVPLMPALRPIDLYTRLFSGLGGAVEPDRMRALLRAHKSVLDHSLRELARLRTLAPAGERAKIDAHGEAVRRVETQLADALAGPSSGACAAPPAPDASIGGQAGSRNDYLGATPTKTAAADDPMLAQTGKLHLAIIRAAFQCDLIRVATFQWAPGTNHVSFHGLYPGDPAGNYMHHPTSHVITDRNDVTTGLPTTGTNLATRLNVIEFLTRVQIWFNQMTAAMLVDLKNSKDVFGAPLLDHTIVPFITEIAEVTSSWLPMPALIFGGRALGMQGGQYLDFQRRPRPFNDLWMTIAQAYLRTTDPVAALADEVFVKTGVAPIPDLWSPPG